MQREVAAPRAPVHQGRVVRLDVLRDPRARVPAGRGAVSRHKLALEDPRRGSRVVEGMLRVKRSDGSVVEVGIEEAERAWPGLPGAVVKAVTAAAAQLPDDVVEEPGLRDRLATVIGRAVIAVWSRALRAQLAAQPLPALDVDLPPQVPVYMPVVPPAAAQAEPAQPIPAMGGRTRLHAAFRAMPSGEEAAIVEATSAALIALARAKYRVGAAATGQRRARGDRVAVGPALRRRAARLCVSRVRVCPPAWQARPGGAGRAAAGGREGAARLLERARGARGAEPGGPRCGGPRGPAARRVERRCGVGRHRWRGRLAARRGRCARGAPAEAPRGAAVRVVDRGPARARWGPAKAGGRSGHRSGSPARTSSSSIPRATSRRSTARRSTSWLPIWRSCSRSRICISVRARRSITPTRSIRPSRRGWSARSTPGRRASRRFATSTARSPPTSS